MKCLWNWLTPEETSPNSDGGERVLRINGVIAEESWLDDDITPTLFASELNAGSGPVTIWLNSPGGDVVAAARIYNMLLDYPGKVTVVQRLFSNYLEGISPEKTANQLNSEGLRSRGGGLFHGSVLRRMLENERYKGCQLLQKTFNKTIRPTSRTPNDGVLTKYWVEQALPVIIEPALFDKVQQEIARRRQIGPAATPSLNTGMFTGRIRCGTCGRNYQRKTRRYTSGNYYHYWRCWSACKGQGNPCGGHNLRETMLQSICATTLKPRRIRRTHC